MYELVEYGQLQPQREKEREMSPYVVRDLSWELARYLDAEDVTDSAATPESTREV